MKKKDVWNLTKKKRKWLNDVYIRAKKLMNEKFRRKMNQNVSEYRKFS